MNLNRLFFVFLLFAATMVTAQVKIGENPNYIDAASIIELESTTKAFVLTRVTETQMQGISPLNGAMVYNIETQCIHYFDGSQWKNLCDASGSGSAMVVNNGNGSYTFTNGNSS
ncbi:MAG: hypothetical protein KJP26_14880, partial [Maribacter sp.]|nr:hypothetical protein [Maribacter sp.]